MYTFYLNKIVLKNATTIPKDLLRQNWAQLYNHSSDILVIFPF